MKIGIVIENISLKAGIEKAVSNLANMLENFTDHSITIYSMYSDGTINPGFFIRGGVKIIHLSYSSNNQYCAYLRLLFDKVHKMDDDDIIIGTTHAINCMLALKRINAKKIGCEHFDYFTCPKKWRWIRKILYKRLDAVVLLTKADSENYKFLNNEKRFVISNSVDEVYSNEYNLTSHIIIAVGRLALQKGFDLLIEAARMIKEDLNEWEIHIYGDGEERHHLESLIYNYDLKDFVKLKGYSKDIMTHMSESGLFVLSSRHEGQGIVLLEAQACGLPIVTFDCKYGPSEIVEEGVSGFLVSEGDLIGLADKIKKLCWDTELRVKFSKAARINAYNHTAEVIIKEWLLLFQTIK